MFDDEQLMKRLHFLSYSKGAKNIYITKEHYNWLQSTMSIICSLKNTPIIISEALYTVW